MSGAITPDTTLLLLHGMGATSGVWSDVLFRLDHPGRVLAPDLPGHGLSPWAPDYSLGAFAAGVSAHCEPGEPVVVLGHSLGGAVGLALASGLFRPDVRAVLALGIKVRWSDGEVAAMATVGARGVRWFESRAEAAERFLRVAGLAGIAGPGGPVGPDHQAVAAGIVEVEGRWRLSQDPATFVQRPPDMARLVAGVHCPVVLGAGTADAMVTGEDLRALAEQPRLAPGRGHNVQVEDPGWVVDELRSLTSH